MFHVFFAALAEFIRALIAEGTHQGLDAARGVRLWRPPALTVEQIRFARDLLTHPENTITSIAKLLDVSRNTIYKYLPEIHAGPALPATSPEHNPGTLRPIRARVTGPSTPTHRTPGQNPTQGPAREALTNPAPLARAGRSERTPSLASVTFRSDVPRPGRANRRLPPTTVPPHVRPHAGERPRDRGVRPSTRSRPCV